MTTDTEASPTLITPKVMNQVSGSGLSGSTGPKRKGLGIATKFFLAAVLLVVATLGVAIAFATWRANQMRKGAIERGRALGLIERDNRPRFPSMQWYLKTIGIDRSVEEVDRPEARAATPPDDPSRRSPCTRGHGT